jgi:TetR/AcrR family transcriptional regulator, tetracycline repressor protein
MSADVAGPRLSRESAVAAALDIVTRDGVEALSMRRLGRELGVDPMAVYHYIPSKQALFDELVAAVWSELELPGEGAWDQQLRELAHAVRSLLTRYANVLPIVATRSGVGAGSLAVLDRGVAILTAAGVDAREAWQILSVASSWLIGHALAEVGRPPGGVADVPEEVVLEAMSGPRVAAEFPHLAAAAEKGLLDWDEVFERGLDTLLEGVRARLRA